MHHLGLFTDIRNHLHSNLLHVRAFFTPTFFALYTICGKFTLFTRILIAHESGVDIKKKLKLDCWAVGRAKLLKYPEQVHHCSKNKLMLVLNFLVSPETVKYFFVEVVYLLLLKSSI